MSFTFQGLVNVVSPSPAVREEKNIPTCDINVEAPKHCSSTFTLNAPCSGHHGVAPIHCLYLSHTVREGHNVSKKVILVCVRACVRVCVQGKSYSVCCNIQYRCMFMYL